MISKINLFNDSKLVYEHWENISASKTKSTLIMCHGYDASSLSFHPIAPILQQKINCYAVNYPAHGQSEGSIKDMQVPLFAESVKTVIKNEGLKNVVLLGHSLGGGVVSYLEKMPEVKGIILLAPINPSIARKELDLKEILLPKTANELMNTWKLLFHNYKKMNNNLFNQKTAELTLNQIKKRRPYSEAVAMDVWNERRQWEILKNYLFFEKPTTIIFGDDDKIIPHEASLMWLKRIIRHASTHVISECGHSPQFEKINEVVQIILEFLNQNFF